MIINKKSAYQKVYLNRLKTNVKDFQTSFKKRFDIFPWKKIISITLKGYDREINITIDETEYTIDDLIDKICSINSDLVNRQKNSNFSKFYKKFLNESKGKNSLEMKEIYNKINDELKEEFSSMKDELNFCLKALQKINKELKNNKEIQNITESEEYIMSNDLYYESVFDNIPDIYYNKYRLDEHSINICFIIGYSGGGKSSISRKEKGYNREVIDLDRIVLYPNKDDHYYKKVGNFAYNFMKGPGKKYRTSFFDICTNDGSYRKNICKDLVSYARTYASSHKNILLFLEGVYIYRYIKPNEVDDCAVYIKGTSLKTSTERAIKRDNASSNEVSKADKNDIHGGKDKNKLQKLGHATVKVYMAFKDALFGDMEKWIKYYLPKYNSQLKKSLNPVNYTKNSIKNEYKAIKHKINNKLKTESEEYTMEFRSLYDSPILNSGEDNEIDRLKSLVESYENLLFDDVKDDLITENSQYDEQIKEIAKEFNGAKKELKTAAMIIIKSINKKDYKNAINETKELKTTMKMGGTIINKPEVQEFCKVNKSFENLVKDILKTFDDIINILSKKTGVPFKGDRLAFCDDLINYIKTLESKKNAKELQNRKAAQVKQESEEYEEQKYYIYKACQDGDITIEEREELLSDLEKDTALMEISLEETDTLEYESVQETYEKVVKALYEKCNNGEISIDEREDLINQAQERLFEAVDNNAQANAATAKESKLQNAAMNVATKVADKVVDTAANKMSDAKIDNATK